MDASKHERSLFEKLKESPLCKMSLDTAPEESAMWLEMHMLGTADGIADVLRCVLKLMRKFPEDSLCDKMMSSVWTLSSLKALRCLPSQAILKSVFEAVFKAGMLDDRPEELEKLLETAREMHEKQKSRAKSARMPRCSWSPSDEIEKLEVVAELVERLEKRVEELRDAGC